MFQKILVAMDSSAAAQAVFASAVALAQAMDAHLMLLHVLHIEDEGGIRLPMYPAGESIGSDLSTPLPVSFFPPYDDLNWKAYRQEWNFIEEEGLERLRLYAEQATNEGVKAEFTQNSGYPGPTIRKLAQTWDSDLIVMGSRGRKGLSEILLGSVSNYVMHHAPCSVLIVPAKTEDKTALSQKQKQLR
ncbi:MAG: universal stress protein [Leptolyngbyaceae cyanobacterium MO_188.B28]|nr:universal stress protein [Leptolyngbyaceae cyanobacterium MO_188.B28]